MPRGGTRLALLATLALVAAPVAARAADTGVATITACAGDHATVAGKVAAGGAVARRVRGSKLQVRFQAFALFGLPRTGQWRDLGRKTHVIGQQSFAGLAAGNWVGVMDWRFRRGSRTVLSGLARSEPLRIGRSNGRSNCVLAEGAKPVDTKAPALAMAPDDASWHHGPVAVHLLAQDDLSGVKSVSYSLDGGPMTPVANGGGPVLGAEGAHRIDWQATDVAGNTATRSATVRVDAGPPSKPVVSKPGSVTASQTPTFQWSPSTDSGSGLRAYVLTIRRADGSIVSVQSADPGVTSLVSSTMLTDGATYSATVTAVDNTVDPAWPADSDPLTFKVDTTPEVASFSPASGTILSGAAKDGIFTLMLDRAADPATVSTSTVVLHRGDGSQPAYTAGCAATPCTAITVDPSSTLSEGHYSLSVNGVKSAGDSLAFTGSAVYAVPFTEGGSLSASTTVACVGGDGTATTTPKLIDAADAGQTAFLDFDLSHSGPGDWTMEALYNSTVIGSVSGQSSGHVRLDFPLGGHTGGTLSFRLTAQCVTTGTSQATATNLLGSRYP